MTAPSRPPRRHVRRRSAGSSSTAGCPVPADVPGEHLQLVPLAGPVPAPRWASASARTWTPANSAALGGVSYLQFLAPGPAGGDGHAVGGVRGDLPDHGAASCGTGSSTRWTRRRSRRGTSPSATSPGSAARLTMIATVFTIVIVAVRGGRVADDRPGHPGGGPDRDGLRGADRRVRRDPVARPNKFNAIFRFGITAAVPVLRDVLPDLDAAASRCRCSPG